MVTASIAGTHLGSGDPQCGLSLAQDLRLIRTWPEKSVGCDYRGNQLRLKQIRQAKPPFPSSAAISHPSPAHPHSSSRLERHLIHILQPALIPDHNWPDFNRHLHTPLHISAFGVRSPSVRKRGLKDVAKLPPASESQPRLWWKAASFPTVCPNRVFPVQW